jgi:hypothetical protein
MKRELYDLTDEPFAMFVNRVGETFREEEIPHNIVGGTAVQLNVLDMLTRIHGTDVQGLVLNPEIRLQNYLRSTDDVDVTLKLVGDDKSRIQRINRVLPKLAFEGLSPSAESIIEIRSSRIAASRPTFRVYVDDRGSEEDVIAMNIGRNSERDKVNGLDNKWYDIFIDNSVELDVPYMDGFSVRANVPKFEHLITSKIAGWRAKDIMDLRNLMDLARDSDREVDYDEMEKALLPKLERKYQQFRDLDYSDPQ